MIGLFCRIQSLLQGSFALETYNFTNAVSHDIFTSAVCHTYMCRAYASLMSHLLGGYGQQDRLNYRSLLQNSLFYRALFYRVARMAQSCHTYGVATISRLLKIIGLFAAYRLFYRALLQKRPVILRSLLIVATPYQTCHGTHKNMASTLQGPPRGYHYIYIYTYIHKYIAIYIQIWGGFGQQAPCNYRSLLQKGPIKQMIFCKRDL